MRKETIGDCTLYLGDCMEVMPLLDRVDAVVTDPPYGLSMDVTMHKSSGIKSGRGVAKKGCYKDTDWDNVSCSDEQINMMLSISDHQIIFGGNYFNLPPSRCWLVWDKINGTTNFADCELAWTNLDKTVKKIEWMWNGMLRKNQEQRYGHPTQKPVGVMSWCLTHLPESAEIIFDPFMGSGTTGVACAKARKKFIGIEINEDYFNIACKRIEDAYRQGSFLMDMGVVKPKEAAKQESLFLPPSSNG